jgi:ribosomal protein S18 acetylase RimI-like enzyme
MMNFEILTPAKLERYFDLRNVFCQFDPYLIAYSLQEFTEKYGENFKGGKILIGILEKNAQDRGYIRIDIEDSSAWLEEIFLLQSFFDQENFDYLIARMIQFLEQRNLQRISYIGVRYPNSLDVALIRNGFVLKKDHVQMEISPLNSGIESNLNFKNYYQIDDPEWILSLIERSMRRKGVYSFEDIQSVINQRSSLSFLAFEGEKPVGFLMGEYNQKRNKQEKQATLYIEELGVLPEERRKGFAAAMIAEAFRRGKTLGADTARLHVFADNIPAYTLYSKLGFQSIKRIGHWLKSVD